MMKHLPPQKQFTHAIGLLNIDKALSKFGCDPDKELGKFGFKPSDFNDGDLKVPLSLVVDIIQHCIEITACKYFILELAAEQTPAINGYLGMLIRTSLNIESAIRLATRDLYLYVKGVAWQLLHEGSQASLRLSLDRAFFEPNQRKLIAELSIVQGWFVLHDQCKQEMKLNAVHFVRSKPDDEGPYRRFFGAPVQFNSDVDQLVFDASQLQYPMSHSDPFLHRAIRDLINVTVKDSVKPTLLEEVCSFIRMLLPQGDCSIDQVAHHLMCDKRSLQRHLRDEFDVSFKELLQGERLELVKRYLRESDKSITQIAYATGYNEPSNMTRSFRKQLNCTPQQWRENYLANQSLPDGGER